MSTATLERPRKTSTRVQKDEEIPTLPNGFEYVDGQLVEGNVSEVSAWVTRKLNFNLDLWARDNPVGVFFSGTDEQGFQCFPFLPRQVRRPDASFVRRDLSKPFLKAKGFTKDVPEFIAEVISPEDLAHKLDKKIAEFLLAGTKLIWVIDPELRSGFVIHSDGVRHPIDENGILDGEDVLPGFAIPLHSILPPRDV